MAYVFHLKKMENFWRQLLMGTMIENPPCFSEESLEYMKSEVQEEIYICWLGGNTKNLYLPYN